MIAQANPRNAPGKTRAQREQEAEATRAHNALNEAVNREASYIMHIPVAKLDVVEIKQRLEAASSVAETPRVFMHHVYNRIVKHYHANDKHAAWFRHEIIPVGE